MSHLGHRTTSSCLGNMWIRAREIFSEIMFHLEGQYENHDSKVTVNHYITRLLKLPIISGRLSLCATAGPRSAVGRAPDS